MDATKGAKQPIRDVLFPKKPPSYWAVLLLFLHLAGAPHNASLVLWLVSCYSIYITGQLNH